MIVLAVFLAFAEGEKIRVKKTYTYIGSTSDSLSIASARAMALAKDELIAENFGRKATRRSSASLPVGPDVNVTRHWVGKGEWVESISERVDSIEMKDRHLYVTVTVDGWIRERTPVLPDSVANSTIPSDSLTQAVPDSLVIDFSHEK